MHSQFQSRPTILQLTAKHNVISKNQPLLPDFKTCYSNVESSSNARHSLDVIEESPQAKSTYRTFRTFVSNYSELSTFGKSSSNNENINIVSHQRREVVLENTMDLNDEEDLPPTQPITSFLFKNVVAYVEIRINDYNRSGGMKEQLRKLGATVLETLTRKVTHTIFQEGTLATYKKAVKYETHLVSVLWIEECKMKRALVPEHLFPPYNLDKYSSPSLVRKIKRMKRDIRLESTKKEIEAEEKWEKRLKEIQEDIKQSNNKLASSPIITAPPIASTPVNNDVVSPPSSANAMIRALKRLAGSLDPKYEEYVRRPASPTSDDDDELQPIPLAVRLMRQMLSPVVNSPPLSENVIGDPASDSTDSIEANLRLMFQTPDPIKTNVCSKTPDLQAKKVLVINTNSSTKTSSPSRAPAINNCTPINPSRRQSLRHQLLFAKTPVPPLLTKDTPLGKNSANRTKQSKSFNNTSTSSSLPSTAKKRKLYNIVRMEDSPKFVPIIEDEEDALPESLTSKLCGSQATQNSQNVQKNLTDMELTDCMPGGIVQTQAYEKSRTQRNLTDMELTACIPGGIIQTDLKKFARERLDENSPKNSRSSRRSSCDFKKRRSCRVIATTKQPPTLVCTGLYKDELSAVLSAVSRLGVYLVADNVISSTSHVVCNDTQPPKRTLNLLKGIARGCWIVGLEWAVKSLEAGKWLSEEDYEITNFSPSVQQCRIEKLSFGPAYQLQLFSNCGPMYICRDCKPPLKDLVELVQLCGGIVTRKLDSAHLVIGSTPQRNSVVQLSEKWLLDSVSDASLRPVKEYRILKSDECIAQ